MFIYNGYKLISILIPNPKKNGRKLRYRTTFLKTKINNNKKMNKGQFNYRDTLMLL